MRWGLDSPRMKISPQLQLTPQTILVRHSWAVTWALNGSVFPDAMEDAIASLEVGGVSSPVTTDAELILFWLKPVGCGAVPDDLLRAEITESLQAAQTQRDLLIAVDQLRDLVFTSSGLTTAAEQLGLSVSTSQPFSRDEGDGLFVESSLGTQRFGRCFDRRQQ